MYNNVNSKSAGEAASVCTIYGPIQGPKCRMRPYIINVSPKLAMVQLIHVCCVFKRWLSTGDIEC